MNILDQALKEAQERFKDRPKYCYTLLRYRHDASLGEFINVGVVATANNGESACVVLNRDYSILQAVFRGFNPQDYLGFLDAVEKAIDSPERPRDMYKLQCWLIPDRELCFDFSSPRGGLMSHNCETLDEAARRVYEFSMVRSRPEK